MEEALRARAAASPAKDAILFIGRVPHSQVERYYALCDIMAYPRKKSRLTDLVTPLKPWRRWRRANWWRPAMWAATAN
jgi:hypothetical protein